MIRRVLIIAFGIAGLMSQAGAQAVPASPIPPDVEIRKILVERIEAGQSVGIVVGVIEPQGRRVVGYGSLAKGDTRPLDGNTIFEIGSVTKVFTSLLLADMAARGELALSDPVAKFLPSSVTVPERGGRVITLVDLATHTSGLPRLPTNMKLEPADNPYAHYSVAQLYEFLSSYVLPRDIGANYEYSNVGGGLLGHVLARRAGMDYEALVRSRICDPLGMSSTRVALSPELKGRFAVGHSPALQPVSTWDFPTLAGAGGLRSSANDMLTFLAAALGYNKTPLSSPMAAMLQVHRPTGLPGLEIGLGWHITTRNGKEIVWHNGGTGGFRSYVGVDFKRRVGVVVLSNAGTPSGIDDIGRNLLDPPRLHTQISVDPAVFRRYLGRYQLTPNFVLTVTADAGHLFVQATGQSKLEVFPESEVDYFYKVVDAQITFETDNKAQAVALVLHQNGLDQRARRIE